MPKNINIKSEELNIKSEEFRKFEIQDAVRPSLEAALKEACPRVTQAGLFWNAGFFSQFFWNPDSYKTYQEKVNKIIHQSELQYGPNNTRFYILELSDRLLEEYKKEAGYQPNPNEKNSPANLTKLHHQITTKLEAQHDLESQALCSILIQHGPTSIITRHVQNYLDEKAGKCNFNKEEKRGMNLLKEKINQYANKQKQAFVNPTMTTKFAKKDRELTSPEPPKVAVTAPLLQL